MGHIKHLVENAEVLNNQPPEIEGRPKYVYLAGRSRPLDGMVLMEKRATDAELVSVFPAVFDLAENELEIHSCEPVKDEDFVEVEGVVRAITQDGGEITFFCPNWLSSKTMIEEGGRFIIGLGAIAYGLEPAQTEIVMTEGAFFETEKKRRAEEDPNFDPASFTSVTVRTDNLRTFFEREDGDFEFQSVVEEVTRYTSMGVSGYILLVGLTPEERSRIAVKIYAAEHLLDGYVPKAGDAVRGVAWLQGVLLRQVEAEASWLDSAEAAHDGGNAGFEAMVSFMFGTPHLPVALQSVGAALVGAGWDIVAIEGKLFRGFAPAFVAKQRDAEFWIFIRTSIKEDFKAEPFQQVDSVQAYAAGKGIRCLWLTVTLESVGRNYAVSVEGLEEFAGELNLPLQVAKPENSEPMNLDAPENKNEPVLDETHAAKVFADSMNHADLSGLSRILVEDLDYMSEAANVRMKGRQNVLSYLGCKLEAWKDEGTQLTTKLGMLDAGDSRPCAITTDKEGQVVARTFFTGRRGHISRILVLPQGGSESTG